jgi:putative ABC transport system permease protein
MFRSALVAALRHLLRGKLFAAISVFGLAVGLCVALHAALYIRAEYSYEHFVKDYQDLYLVTTLTTIPGRGKQYSVQTPHILAALVEQRFPEVISASRISSDSVVLRLGDLEMGGNENEASVFAVDPDFFDTAPMPVLAGDPVAALAKPDTVVMARGIARRLFGEDAPLGRTMEAEKSGQVVTLTVGAVLDEVKGSRLFSDQSIFVSGESAWTGLAHHSRLPPGISAAALRGYVTTLVRLKPGAAPQPVHDALPEISPQLPGWSSAEELDMIRIDTLRTDPDYNPAITYSIVAMSALAMLILFIASMNFVSLLTARSGVRTLEIGVRKLAGASRTTLALQFLGETFLYVMAAVLVALAMTELVLPRFNGLLLIDADFEYWKDPALIGWLGAGTVVFGLLAGFWPAVVLSGMRPIGALHGARVARGRGGRLRNLLVALQFAVLTLLILRVVGMYMQRQFATQQALRFDIDQVLILETGCSPGRMTELRRIPGVIDAACSGTQLLGGEGTSNGIDARTRDGRKVPMAGVWIDDRMLDLYGVEPLAGRGLTADDFGAGHFGRHSTRFLINESAMRALGFDSPAAALGPYPLMPDTPALTNGRPAGNGLDEIIGVLPDVSMASLRRRIEPTVFYADPIQFSTISLRLSVKQIPETLAAIDHVWKNTRGRGGDAPVGNLKRMFYDERLDRIYLPMMVEAQIFGFISVVGISLALLGLLGIAASAADRRTREIGIRKALGATTGDVLRLLLTQFSQPVIWGNLIAWPIGGWMLHRFLSGFAYRIDLPLWLFPGTALVILLVALATVGTHALRVAQTRPVAALRHQ